MSPYDIKRCQNSHENRQLHLICSLLSVENAYLCSVKSVLKLNYYYSLPDKKYKNGLLLTAQIKHTLTLVNSCELKLNVCHLTLDS